MTYFGVFFKFNVNLFANNYSQTFTNSLLITDSNNFNFLSAYKLVSSANKTEVYLKRCKYH